MTLRSSAMRLGFSFSALRSRKRKLDLSLSGKKFVFFNFKEKSLKNYLIADVDTLFENTIFGNCRFHLLLEM